MTRRTPRDFDSVAIAAHETDAWVGYYRHDWRLVLAAALGMVREGFGMAWPHTVRGAWHVLRANQAWAPYPDNDPDGARRHMRAFYAIVVAHTGLEIDPVRAAELDVEWWRAHRFVQREQPGGTPGYAGPAGAEFVEALTALYAYTYATKPDDVRPAARHRVDAMRISDDWVAAGCDLADPRIAHERRALVRSYSALLDAVSQTRSVG